MRSNAFCILQKMNIQCMGL